MRTEIYVMPVPGHGVAYVIGSGSTAVAVVVYVDGHVGIRMIR